MTDPAASIKHALTTVAAGEVLDAGAAEAFMAAVLDGEVTPAQLGGLLVGMRARGETSSELTGFVRALRSRARAVDVPTGTIDTCGTGGDVRGTFNISTASALVVAAAGVPVAKAGNKAVSSRAGSSDVMGALGLRVEQTPEEAAATLAEDGFTYLHAPAFHPGMRHAGPVRMELGVRTAFNMIGPLANPARPRRQLVGVPDAASAERVAGALHELGSERAFVVHGERIDELPLDGSGVVYDVSPSGVERRTVRAEDVGLVRAETDAFSGDDSAHNAALIVSILTGRESGPKRDVVTLNAGASLVVAGRADDLEDGVALARETIDSGAAIALLERLRVRAASAAATADAADPAS